MAATWMDGLVGWSKDFNRIETCIPDDPAVDDEATGMDGFDRFNSDNFNMEHLKFKDGQKPVKMIITLPSSSQWASIVPYMRDASGDAGVGSVSVAFLKLFELCVRFPEVESAKPVHRDGFLRLPEAFVRGLLIGGKRLWLADVVGNWLVSKYVLTEDEKKAS